MSGIAGLWNLDGRPAAREDLEAMAGAAMHRGPDGVGYWLDGPVGFVHLALQTTPESKQERQPLAVVTPAGTLCLTFDGRLDNREELASGLRSAGAETPRATGTTDAELVLWAYRLWGEDCPRRLLGDFAFALWDGPRRKLFCARDIIGFKPFFYFSDSRHFLFASQPAQILACPGVPCEPDEVTACAHIADLCELQGDRSFFRGIRRLLPAHRRVTSEAGYRLDRYWEPQPERGFRALSDADQAASFREVFSEAVRCRLRSSGRIGAYLSGGLDSSSVVGVTQSLIRDGRASAPGFEVFSAVFPGRPTRDESSYIQAVTGRWGLTVTTVDPEAEDIHRYAEDVRRHKEVPFHPTGRMLTPLLTSARDRGFRVILTGLGGDEWLNGSPLHLADLLRQGRLLHVASGLRSKRSLERLWRSGLRPLLGSWLPPRLRRALRRGRPNPPWLGEGLARRIGLEDLRAVQPAPWEGSLGFEGSDRLSRNVSGWPLHATETDGRLASVFGVEYRHPFHDRRVIELALGLAAEQRERNGIEKHILREALAEALPPEVRGRRTKAEFSAVAVAALRVLARPSEALAVEARGWVKGDVVRGMYADVSSSADQGWDPRGQAVNVLWSIFSLELWLRLVFNR